MTPYTREKFYLAMRGIALSSKPAAERLSDAWVYHLMHAQDQDNPPRVREQFEKLAQYFREVEDQNIGSALASARNWNAEKIEEVADAMAAIALWETE